MAARDPATEKLEELFKAKFKLESEIEAALASRREEVRAIDEQIARQMEYLRGGSKGRPPVPRLPPAAKPIGKTAVKEKKSKAKGKGGRPKKAPAAAKPAAKAAPAAAEGVMKQLHQFLKENPGLTRAEIVERLFPAGATDAQRGSIKSRLNYLVYTKKMAKVEDSKYTAI